MLGRYAIGAGLALVVSFGLFFLMQSLIAMGEAALDDSIGGRVIEFVRLKREESTQLKKREMPQRLAPKDQPEPPAFDLPSSPSMATGESISIAVPKVERKLELSGGPALGTAPSDTDVIPLVRVQPTYPRRAAERRIEGWVQVEFTISITGAVKNARVLGSEPAGVFDRAALRAIRKWKYKPKIEEGVAVERHGIRVQLTFDLQDEQ